MFVNSKIFQVYYSLSMFDGPTTFEPHNFSIQNEVFRATVSLYFGISKDMRNIYTVYNGNPCMENQLQKGIFSLFHSYDDNYKLCPITTESNLNY